MQCIDIFIGGVFLNTHQARRLIQFSGGLPCLFKKFNQSMKGIDMMKSVSFNLNEASIIADVLEQVMKRVEQECQEFGIDRSDSICPELDSLIQKIEGSF
jgi:hypothetical protein